MKKMETYNFVVYPTYKYVTLDCCEEYFNLNFDKILKILGKYYFNNPDLGSDGICSLIKDKINRDWHLNGFKKSVQLKRVSSNQVKTIRRSFRKLRNKKQNYIRIPFYAVPILFFILNLLHSIPVAELDMEEKQFLNSLVNSDMTIKEFLYGFHAKIFLKEYGIIKSFLTDDELVGKYQKLYANLTNLSSVANCTYREIKWDEIRLYIIN